MTARLLTASEIEKADRAELLRTVLRAGSAAAEATRSDPVAAARRTRRVRANMALYGVGGLTAAGGTLGLAQSVGNRIGPARKVKLVEDRRRKKEPASKGFLTRDMNSSPGASISVREPGARFRSGRLKGQARISMEPRNSLPSFVARDQNSSPGVTRLTPRKPNGQYVSHENDLQVFHPTRYGSSRRQPRDSQVQRWGKGKDDQSRAFLGKREVGKVFGVVRPPGMSTKPIAQVPIAGRVKPKMTTPVRTTVKPSGARFGKRLTDLA